MVPHFLLSPSRFRDKNTYKCMPKVNDQFLHNYTINLHVHVAIVVQEVEKSSSNQKVASSIPCRSVLEQDTEPLIAPDVQCHQCKSKMCIHCKSHICKSLWIKASAKCKCKAWFLHILFLLH